MIEEHRESRRTSTEFQFSKFKLSARPRLVRTRLRCPHCSFSSDAALGHAPATMTTPRHWLYASHAMAQISDAAWQFAVALVLLQDQNLRAVASYGATVAVAVWIGVPWMGRLADKAEDRWRLLRRWIGLGNGAVVLGTGLLLLWLRHPSHPAILAALLLVGALGEVWNQAKLLAVERDWIVVLAEDDVQWLSTTNVALKQLDLAAKILGPVLSGVLLGYSLSMGCVVVGALNLLSLLWEYMCMQQLWNLSDALRIPRSPPSGARDRLSCSLDVYYQQPTCWVGVGLALLYLNALTLNNGLITDYLLYRQLSLEHVGLLRGGSSLLGLLGTVVYHLVVGRLGCSLPKAAMGSILFQFSCLAVGAAAFWHDTDWSLVVWLIGICGSRIGLWVYDISVTQLQQLCVPDGARATVGGIQQSMNSFFYLLVFIMGMVFSDPSEFDIFVGTAVSTVGLAAICCAYGVATQGLEDRGELVPQEETDEHIPTEVEIT